MNLFAEIELPAQMPMWVVVISIVAVSLLFAAYFFWLVFSHAAKNRQFSHLERMKALEVGKPIEEAEPEGRSNKYLHNAFWIAFWIGAAVPISAMSAASSIMIQGQVKEFSLVLAIWICVAVISAFGVVSATALMARCRNCGGETPR